MANTNAHTPAQRAAETIAELQQTHNGTTIIKDPLILVRALTRKASRHGGSIPELMPVEMPLKMKTGKTTISICAAHFKATLAEPEAFVAVIHDVGTGEYELTSTNEDRWKEVPWLSQIIQKAVAESLDLEQGRNLLHDKRGGAHARQ